MKRPLVMFSLVSPGSIRSLEMDKVVQLTSALQAELELFHCIFDPEITRDERFATRGVEADIQEVVYRRRQQLENGAEGLRAKGLVVHTSVRWDYPVYEGVVRQVLRRNPTLLVAQSSRRGRAARLLLTQTDHRLIENCPCPVLFIKNAHPYSAPTVIAAVDPQQAHGKPAALDERILDTAGMISGALGGTLRLFHAGAPTERALRMEREVRDLPEAVKDDVRTAYWNEVRRPVLALARRHHIAEERVDTLEGEAAELLPRIAKAKSATIMALGAVFRSRIGRALLGHTAERVLDELECDVLIVKPPGFRTEVKVESTHLVDRRAFDAYERTSAD